jgi:acyl carrier protein
MSDREEIFSKVRESLVEALSVDDDEVTVGASLTRDLGAESIDFLDIVFRLEKSFGIKIPRGDLFPENLLTNPEFVQDGKLTPAGLGELKKRMPFADISKFEQNPLVGNLGDIFTVGMIVGYIESRVPSN